jgi:hypothetical protein
VTTMYLREPDAHGMPARPIGAKTAAVLALTVVGIVWLGLFPGGWLELVASTPWIATGF